jgi:hypothetical protein
LMSSLISFAVIYSFCYISLSLLSLFCSVINGMVFLIFSVCIIDV